MIRETSQFYNSLNVQRTFLLVAILQAFTRNFGGLYGRHARVAVHHHYGQGHSAKCLGTDETLPLFVRHGQAILTSAL